MRRNSNRVVLEVEVLEHRYAPAAINPVSAAAGQALPSAPPQGAESGQTSQSGATVGPPAFVPPNETVSQSNPATFNGAQTTTVPQSSVSTLQSGPTSFPVPSNQSGFATPTLSGMVLEQTNLSGFTAPSQNGMLFNGSNFQQSSGLTLAAVLGPTAIQSPQFSPIAIENELLPTQAGTGATPLDNSIPNAAQTMYSGAGLNSYSAFLPAYYIGYTQTGPFYTGGDIAVPPPSATQESPSLYPATTVPDSTTDIGAMVVQHPGIDPMLLALATLPQYAP
jgi:hypothetical protein